MRSLGARDPGSTSSPSASTGTVDWTNQRIEEHVMTGWIPLLVRQEDYAEFAAQVASREVGREDSGVIPSFSSCLLYTSPSPRD